MIRAAIALLMLCIGTATAADNLPLFYSRTQIMILPKMSAPQPAPAPPVAATLPWKNNGRHAPQGNMNIPKQPTSYNFDVEVRDGHSLHVQGWFSMSEMEEHTGVLLMYPEPTLVKLGRMNNYAPLDVLMIAADGTIKQIFSKLVFAELKAGQYESAEPVMGVLYIRGGSAAQLNIQPGDEVQYKMFANKRAPAPDEVQILTPNAPEVDKQKKTADELMQQILRQEQQVRGRVLN